MQVPLIQLRCGVNSYDWGKKGRESAAAKFAAATPSPELTIQDDRPYAEVCPFLLPCSPSPPLPLPGPTFPIASEDNVVGIESRSLPR